MTKTDIPHPTSSRQEKISPHRSVVTAEKRIFWVAVIKFTVAILEILGGVLAGSLALFHSLSDTIAIVLSYLARRQSRQPASAKRPFGYKRAEILAAFVNSIALLVISLLLIVEAFRRFHSPETIKGELMILAAVIGLIGNLVSIFILRSEAHENLNFRSSYLHILSDLLSMIGVLFGGIAIKLWNWVWIDPLLTIFIAVYFALESLKILKKTTNILMQSSASFDFDQIQNEILTDARVNAVDQIRTWMIDEKQCHFEAQLELDDLQLHEVDRIIADIEQMLRDKYPISSVSLLAKCSGLKKTNRRSIGNEKKSGEFKWKKKKCSNRSKRKWVNCLNRLKTWRLLTWICYQDTLKQRKTHMPEKISIKRLKP